VPKRFFGLCVTFSKISYILMLFIIFLAQKMWRAMKLLAKKLDMMFLAYKRKSTTAKNPPVEISPTATKATRVKASKGKKCKAKHLFKKKLSQGSEQKKVVFKAAKQLLGAYQEKL
jgi:hypothetical protein